MERRSGSQNNQPLSIKKNSERMICQNARTYYGKPLNYASKKIQKSRLFEQKYFQK